MRHPVLARLSALLLAWVAFLIVAIGILLANQRLANTGSFLLIGAVTIAAALAGAAAYLATSTALADRGPVANWCTFLLAALVNVTAFAFLATPAFDV